MWLTPTVIRLRLEPPKKLRFTAGQFLSIVVPRGFSPPAELRERAQQGQYRSLASRYPLEQPLWRVYSFASEPEEKYLELCVKHVDGGAGSSYVASLRVGDLVTTRAPYGDFFFETEPSRNACFISTGTGIAPFRSMVRSRHWETAAPRSALVISGARTSDEILYAGEFEPYGVESVYAVSDPDMGWSGFRGRVTDYLRSLPLDWHWQTTDFYLCGSPAMVQEVRSILVNARSVPQTAIIQEAYFGASDWKKPGAVKLPLAA
jgi:Na+-transporting NADH:ubiquinone oxidoreductase subunit F